METISMIIGFTIANALVSLFAAYAFTGDTSKNHKDKLFQPIANKKWKTFLIFFISYWAIAIITVYFNKP